MSKPLQLGDFSGLGKSYSENRPDYCEEVLHAILGVLKKRPDEIIAADVGAGTGIWTRMLAASGITNVYAIEPNDDMRLNAKEGYPSIKWMEGTAEKTGLPSSSIDWVTMASSFHWADFDTATKEFWRVLKPGGWFTALWNPRLIEANPLLVEIEDYIKFQIPKLERVSSGRSGITNTLNERLESSPFFENVIYIEGHHKINMSPERYIGAWRSVNDLQVKLGPKRFEDFITYLWEKVGSLPAIETTYLTRAWSARKIGS